MTHVVFVIIVPFSLFMRWSRVIETGHEISVISQSGAQFNIVFHYINVYRFYAFMYNSENVLLWSIGLRLEEEMHLPHSCLH